MNRKSISKRECKLPFKTRIVRKRFKAKSFKTKISANIWWPLYNKILKQLIGFSINEQVNKNVPYHLSHFPQAFIFQSREWKRTRLFVSYQKLWRGRRQMFDSHLGDIVLRVFSLWGIDEPAEPMMQVMSNMTNTKVLGYDSSSYLLYVDLHYFCLYY